MDEDLEKQRKKGIIKDIILKLHEGLSVEKAKERFEREVGSINSTEIAEIEQSLINEGLSPEKIKKFCNVHALIFESTLTKSESKDESPISHFKNENQEIQKITNAIKEIINEIGRNEFSHIKQKIKGLLTRLEDIEIHYTRKENLLFPYLEKYGFSGPSQVMWGKDNEIRSLLKKSLSQIEEVDNKAKLSSYIDTLLNPLIEEVDGMIFKEENILFPTSLEKLSVSDWDKIVQESGEIGYAFIEQPKENDIQELKESSVEEPYMKDDVISLPSGEFKIKDLIGIFNTLPVDITFVDTDDRVKFYSEGKERIFVRTKSVLGRRVQNCHPPESVDVVEKLLASFKDGSRDSVDFWINLQGRLVYIRYFAVRDKEQNYRGTLEVTQDITDIQKLKGEKRLLDEREDK